jgi:hypothetical protein
MTHPDMIAETARHAGHPDILYKLEGTLATSSSHLN